MMHPSQQNISSQRSLALHIGSLAFPLALAFQRLEGDEDVLLVELEFADTRSDIVQSAATVNVGSST